MPYLNDYQELKLRKGEGCEPVLTDDTIFDVEGLAHYLKRNKGWVYKNSHKLPHIQTGKRGGLRFRKSDIDKYLKSQSTPGIGG